MSTKAVSEWDGKRILARWITESSGGEYKVEDKAVRVESQKSKQQEQINNNEIGYTAMMEEYYNTLSKENPWLLTNKLVVKPDQLIKRRGKAGLLGINLDWEQVKQWINERMDKEVAVEQGRVKGILNTFIVEPFVPHQQSEEVYVCIHNTREGEEILFYHEGGVDIGDVDSKASKLQLNISQDANSDIASENLLTQIEDPKKRSRIAGFISVLHRVYRDLHFSYLEINPLVILENGNSCVPLDLAAKLDETAEFLVGNAWGPKISFPPPFGRPRLPAEEIVHNLDQNTGASLKLTILNPKGRVWTMVAGGGASVVYADTIVDLGFGAELANYGEYSGDPSQETTYEYARAILDVMTQEIDPRGKVLIIGGGIANFTDVAKTFKGIIRALTEYGPKLIRGNIVIWVRRGGPNYQEGLRMMRDLGKKIGVPIHVYGPNTNIVAVVPMALGLTPADEEESQQNDESDDDDSKKDSKKEVSEKSNESATANDNNDDTLGKKIKVETDSSLVSENTIDDNSSSSTTKPETFTSSSRAIIYGLQLNAVQGMLDFDYICQRKIPSVAAMVFPFSGNHNLKFYWGKDEVLVPVYTHMNEALKKHPDVDVFINFASFRSAYSVSMEALQHSDQLRAIAIIAEGIPEQYTRKMIREADRRGVLVVGPATVGGIKPGCFRIGNTGGMIDNVIASKLYRPGSVAYVSKSGGMSNELNNIISRVTDGVCEGIAIGGDRYPGSRFLDHVLRFQNSPSVKMIVLLGEVGGKDEYDICEALKTKKITKPIVAWTIGTCAKMFPYSVQFGHAGACSESDMETADAKNIALRNAGAIVPNSFDRLGESIKQVYNQLVKQGVIKSRPEPPKPTVPLDFKWAKQLGLVRKPAEFITTISDDRGEEVLYAGMPISRVIEENLGIGGVISLLWFKRRLPNYATKFIEMILVVTADHGPAVSGAHNSIVTARAGKDLISSLCSGLLTIGPRFGGALDDAAVMFSNAVDRGMTAKQFVTSMHSKNELIMGIGHRIKSINNPDMRVVLIREFAKRHFPRTEVLDFGFEVERITTQKKANLILNVDGAIACSFVDMLRTCGAFTQEEADDTIRDGCLNGLFVLGRSIGFIGHYLDQKRLKQGLYRHPWDDISYQLPSMP